MIKIEIKGVGRLQKTLEQTRRAATNWEGARELILRTITGQFRRQAGRIPRDSGLLAASLLVPNHPLQRLDVRGSSIRFGTLVEYAQYQKDRLPRLGADPIARALDAHVQAIINRGSK